jgi:signal transduction histidine kinase
MLAALDAAAERLRGPLAAARAAGRLLALDREVRRLDRLAALGGLAAEIAHEIRNPLVSVKTFLQLLPERRHEPDFSERFLAVADAELRRMERLLDVLLGYARPDEAAPAGPARVGPVLESVAELVRHGALRRGVSLEWDVAANTPAAALGEDALRQVLLNLALNALDATPPAGCVRIAARACARGVALVVSDRGPGVPPEQREAIFEPFTSSRGERPGGLGLAIVRRIVQEAGGVVAVGDAPGGGAEFRVELP